MRRRLLISTALIALIAVVVLGVPLGVVEAHRVRQEAEQQLLREADGVAVAIDDRLERGTRLDPRPLARLVTRRHEVTVAVPGRPVVRVGTPIAAPAFAQRSPLAQSAVVVARASKEELDERIRARWASIAAFAVAGVLAAVGLGVAQSRRLADPLERLAGTARLLGAGDFSARAGRFQAGEIDTVAAALDASAESIARLLASERQFSANASHQLRTPLTALRLRLEELQQLDDPVAVRAEVGLALAEADRLERTISDLLAAARGSHGKGNSEPVALGELLRTHAGTWQPLFARAGRELRLEVPRSAATTEAPGAVGQAVDVLLDNALHHGAGRVLVRLQPQGTGRVEIEVGDEGSGPPAGLEEAIFDRGHSREGGDGLGLHLARSLVRAAGGDVVLAAREPIRFAIRLRAPDTPSASPRRSAERVDRPCHHETDRH